MGAMSRLGEGMTALSNARIPLESLKFNFPLLDTQPLEFFLDACLGRAG